MQRVLHLDAKSLVHCTPRTPEMQNTAMPLFQRIHGQKEGESPCQSHHSCKLYYWGIAQKGEHDVMTMRCR